jgi:hypothetical protein
VRLQSIASKNAGFAGATGVRITIAHAARAVRAQRERSMSRMIMLLALAASLVAPPCFADDRDKVIGTWKLVSYEVEVQATGEKLPVMGKNPTGYVVFNPEGRVFFVLTGEGRQPAKTDKERADLLSTLVAYTGTYRIEGDKWITKVEVAWDPAWVGTEQVRPFTLDGDRLQTITPWRVMPNWADKGSTRSIVTFTRSK